MKGGFEMIDALEQDLFLKDNPAVKTALRDMRILLNYCTILGIYDKIQFDLSLARGLDYYTGVIYEAVLKGMFLNYCFLVYI